MKVHHLRPAEGARTAKTRVGRGEGSKGKTAGRGTKGTKARYQVPAVGLPFLSGEGAGFTAAARHAEVVDPYRDGVPAATSRCDRG